MRGSVKKTYGFSERDVQPGLRQSQRWGDVVHPRTMRWISHIATRSRPSRLAVADRLADRTLQFEEGRSLSRRQRDSGLRQGEAGAVFLAPFS